MNIIWLTPEVPYPPIGGRNGVYNRIVQLSKYNNIFLFSIAYDDKEKDAKEEMQKYCKEVNFYNRNASYLKKIVKSIFMPYSVASRTLPEMQRELRRVIHTTKIDAIIVDFPNMAKNILDISANGIYCTLNQHNIEFQRMRDMVSVKTIPLYKRAAYYLESYRLENYEKKIYKKCVFNSITFFSEEDLRIFELKWGIESGILRNFPLGANRPKHIPVFNNEHNLLYVGRLDDVAIPNIEAALWFHKNVFPEIVRQLPDVKLIIAGANPSSRIQSLISKNVTLIPNYNNPETVYGLANCVILPLLSGGGVKGKLLEAAAFKKIIISTPHGIEGTVFKSNKHVLLANNVKEFADCCIEALMHTQKYKNMASEAFNLYEEMYDWNSIGFKYYDFLNKMVKESRE